MIIKPTHANDEGCVFSVCPLAFVRALARQILCRNDAAEVGVVEVSLINEEPRRSDEQF